MKKYIQALIISFLIVFSFSGFSQEKTEEDAPKKKNETKISEVVTTDSLPASELLQRAVNWVKIESNRYGKTSGVTTGSKAECTATFPVKPKELNPEVDYTGKISMKVTIECKNNKYKYTVSNIKHLSTSGRTTAGSIDNKVPECGSMAMGDVVWKKLKGEALKDAGKIVEDIKEGMQKSSAEAQKEEW
jgi:predicted nucleic acid binding AN1-type Zn finger protein